MEATVSPDKLAAVNNRLALLGVCETDLAEEFIRGSGAGGQKINKTSSCVQLTYLKKGWVIRCQASRSRELNRFLARRKLAERLEDEKLGRESAHNQRLHKIRAQKKRRSRRTKEKMLAQKKHRGEIKRGRRGGGRVWE